MGNVHMYIRQIKKPVAVYSLQCIYTFQCKTTNAKKGKKNKNRLLICIHNVSVYHIEIPIGNIQEVGSLAFKKP